MARKIKAAVVGVGVGMAHADGYQAWLTQNSSLSAMLTHPPEQRGDHIGNSCFHAVTDYNDLLKPELDVVSVGLPNYLHARSRLLLRAGKHVSVRETPRCQCY